MVDKLKPSTAGAAHVPLLANMVTIGLTAGLTVTLVRQAELPPAALTAVSSRSSPSVRKGRASFLNYTRALFRDDLRRLARRT